MLDNLITSKTRLRLLVKFFLNAATEGYLRGLADELDENTNAIRKELNNLSEAGFIIRTEEGSKITYQANPTNPFFSILQQLVRKYVGIDALIEQIIDKAGSVEQVFLIGDYAKGIDSGHIEVVVLGKQLNATYLYHLALKVASITNKQISIYTEKKEENGLLLYQI